jgi:hypothetical protein
MFGETRWIGAKAEEGVGAIPIGSFSPGAKGSTSASWGQTDELGCRRLAVPKSIDSRGVQGGS